MRIFKFLLLSLVAIAFFSCEPTYVKEYSWAYPLSGDWKVNAYIDGEKAGGPYEIKVYNSSFGQDSIWIDDYATTSSNGHFWSMKFKAAADMTSKTFQTSGSKNAIAGYGIVISVANGKVINTDSITMDLIFSDDPTTTYQLAGRRLVGYDDYMGN